MTLRICGLIYRAHSGEALEHREMSSERKIIYQSSNYDPTLVTGIYVRCHGRKPNYIYRVFERESFAGKPGMGGTLREYDCDGSELPEAVRNEAISSKQTVKWC